MQCEHIKEDGTQCRGRAKTGLKYCAQHYFLHDSNTNSNTNTSTNTNTTTTRVSYKNKVGEDLIIDQDQSKDNNSTDNKDSTDSNTYKCGNCEHTVTKEDSFCPSCGQELEWDKIE